MAFHIRAIVRWVISIFGEGWIIQTAADAVKVNRTGKSDSERFLFGRAVERTTSNAHALLPEHQGWNAPRRRAAASDTESSRNPSIYAGCAAFRNGGTCLR